MVTQWKRRQRERAGERGGSYLRWAQRHGVESAEHGALLFRAKRHGARRSPARQSRRHGGRVLCRLGARSQPYASTGGATRSRRVGVYRPWKNAAADGGGLRPEL